MIKTAVGLAVVVVAAIVAAADVIVADVAVRGSNGNLTVRG